MRALALVLVLAACQPTKSVAEARMAAAATGTPGGTDMKTTLAVESSGFAAGAEMPTKYTCEGGDVSPPLSWSDAPEGTKSFAVIVDDPDAPDPAAPQRVWVHWVLHGIPATTTSLSEGASRGGLPPGTVVGKNDWGKPEYGGPCPPIGRHRYFHKVYALDGELALPPEPTKAELVAAMEGHVLGFGELVGTYRKTRG